MQFTKMSEPKKFTPHLIEIIIWILVLGISSFTSLNSLTFQPQNNSSDNLFNQSDSSTEDQPTTQSIINFTCATLARATLLKISTNGHKNIFIAISKQTNKIKGIRIFLYILSNIISFIAGLVLCAFSSESINLDDSFWKEATFVVSIFFYTPLYSKSLYDLISCTQQNDMALVCIPPNCFNDAEKAINQSNPAEIVNNLKKPLLITIITLEIIGVISGIFFCFCFYLSLTPSAIQGLGNIKILSSNMSDENTYKTPEAFTISFIIQSVSLLFLQLRISCYFKTVFILMLNLFDTTKNKCKPIGLTLRLICSLFIAPYISYAIAAPFQMINERYHADNFYLLENNLWIQLQTWISFLAAFGLNHNAAGYLLIFMVKANKITTENKDNNITTKATKNNCLQLFAPFSTLYCYHKKQSDRITPIT